MNPISATPEFLAKLFAQPGTVVLIALLLTAAVIDWRTYRIPNWLTVGGMVFGLLYNTVAPAQLGFLAALAGLGVGLAILLPLHLLRVMGAGDVKLMAMVGSFLGVAATLNAVLLTFIAGGVAALAFALWHRAFRRMAGNVRDIAQSMAFAAVAGIRPTPTATAVASVGKLPYGISICVGTIASLAATQLGFA
ncbi:MAG TPA: A24 family peptidase [Ramlibacter sp.]|nr:A24 family peptidase [Ramlibacter sp.]